MISSELRSRIFLNRSLSEASINCSILKLKSVIRHVLKFAFQLKAIHSRVRMTLIMTLTHDLDTETDL